MDAMPTGWTRRTVAEERALERIVPEARFLFGLGPRRAAPEHEARAANLLAALGPEVRALRWCRQVHGRVLASLSAEPGQTLTAAACVGRCDGLVTDDEGVGLLVWTADCVPVLMAGGGVIAAVHAGWRGVASGVVSAAVRRMQVEYGVAPADLTTVLGPAVGACHYRVGDEVVEALRRTGVDPGSWLRGDRVELRDLVSAELEGLGVPPGARQLIGGCTACDRRFASYRRDGDRAGRQWSLIVRCGAFG